MLEYIWDLLIAAAKIPGQSTWTDSVMCPRSYSSGAIRTPQLQLLLQNKKPSCC